MTLFAQENLDRIPDLVKMFQGSNITFEESSICNKLKKLNVSKSRFRPEWASSTDINKTPVSKLVVYRGMINDVTV